MITTLTEREVTGLSTARRPECGMTGVFDRSFGAGLPGILPASEEPVHQEGPWTRDERPWDRRGSSEDSGRPLASELRGEGMTKAALAMTWRTESLCIRQDSKTETSSGIDADRVWPRRSLCPQVG